MTVPFLSSPLAGGIASGVGTALGGIFGGGAQKAASKAQTKEQAREYDLGGWQSAAHGAETAGLRDKLLALFGQIAGQGPQQFKPRDAFNPTGTNANGQPVGPAQGQMGGMNPAQFSLPQNYKMGDGGVNPDVYTWLLHSLGYRPPDDPARMKQAASLQQLKDQYAQQNAPKPGGGYTSPYGNPGGPMSGLNPGSWGR